MIKNHIDIIDKCLRNSENYVCHLISLIKHIVYKYPWIIILNTVFEINVNFLNVDYIMALFNKKTNLKRNYAS